MNLGDLLIEIDQYFFLTELLTTTIMEEFNTLAFREKSIFVHYLLFFYSFQILFLRHF